MKAYKHVFTEADIGKKVLCIDAPNHYYGLQEGAHYIIKQCWNGNMLELECISGSWCTSRFELVEDISISSSLLPFSYDLYRQGYKAVCRDRDIEVVQVLETKCEDKPYAVTFKQHGKTVVHLYSGKDGMMLKEHWADNDLFLLPKEKWVNILLKPDGTLFSNIKSHIYGTKEEAEKIVPLSGWKRLAVVKIP